MNTKTIAAIGSEITAILTALSMIPYTIGDAAEIIPPAWKPYILAVGGIATILLRAVKVWADARNRSETSDDITKLKEDR